MSTWYIYNVKDIETAERKAFANAFRFALNHRQTTKAFNKLTASEVEISSLSDADIKPENGYEIFYCNEVIKHPMIYKGCVTKILGFRETSNGQFAAQMRDDYLEIVSEFEEQIINFDFVVEGTGYESSTTTEPTWNYTEKPEIESWAV